MDYVVTELWNAMKNAKYRNTLAELNQVRGSDFKDITSFMNELLSVVARAVHAEVGTLWYYSRFVDGKIHPKAVYGGKDIGDFSLEPGEGVAGQVIASGKGCLIQDCQKDPRWSDKADAATGFVTKSIICVPISDEESCFGCIQIINRTDGNIYDAKDYQFISQLAIEVGKIFKSYSSALVLGHFDVFGDEKRVFDFNRLFESKTEEEMEEVLQNMPIIKTMDAMQLHKFNVYSHKLWKVLHPKK